MSNLMELIQRIKDEENPSREGINYFIVDIVVVLLSWNNTFIPEVSVVRDSCFKIHSLLWITIVQKGGRSNKVL